MSDSPERIAELRMWVAKAEGDLAAAELLHDIPELVALLPVEQQPQIDAALAADLTDYAVWSRYPGSPEPTPHEVREGIRGAHAVRDWVRARLPSAALRP